MKIEIKNRFTGDVIFTYDVEGNTIRETVQAAVAAGISLRGADLSETDLSETDLRGANLSEADLSEADLSKANLRGANLSWTDLRGVNLSETDLSKTNLTPIRDDIWSILSAAPAEVPALIAALKSGKVDGSTYEGGCCCLVGTIANAKGCSYGEIAGITPDSSRPAERFFMGIRKGDTPETNQFSALALQWVEEWQARNSGNCNDGHID